MNNNSWIIWNTLVKTDYKITYITINVNYIPNVIYRNSLEIKIKFENHDMIEKFSNLVFKQYGIDIRFNIYDNSFDIELKNSNPTHMLDNKNILECLLFPPDVDCIEIVVLSNQSFFSDTPHIKLLNLSENLHQLKIYSQFISFDLSNLPTDIILLDVSECESKLNLDYLPWGLKILNLPNIKQRNFNNSYNLSDLSNLPLSLIQINVGHIVFKSIKDLIETFDKKIKQQIELNNKIN